MGNPFVHVEPVTTDVAKAKSFYGKLFKWKLEDVDMGDMTYTLIKVDEGTGLMKNPMPDGHSMWIAYVKVANYHGPDRGDARPLGAEEEEGVILIPGWRSGRKRLIWPSS